MNYRWKWIAAASIGAVGIAAIMANTEKAVPASQNVDVQRPNVDDIGAAETARLVALESRIAALQERVSVAESAITARPFGSTPQEQLTRSAEVGTSAATEGQRTTPNDREAAAALRSQEEQDKVSQQQTVAALETQLAIEDYDGGWDTNIQAELDQSLKLDSFDGTRLSGVQCKTTLCRVALAYDNVEAEMQFFENLDHLPIMRNTQAYYQRESNADGSVSLVMYVAREGKLLPLTEGARASN